MASLRAVATLLVLAAMLLACGEPPPPGSPLSVAELKYRLFDQLGRVAYCDRDFYPIARFDEKVLAVQHFPEVQADATTYQAILRRNGLAGAVTDEQKVVAYRDWKQLNALALEPVDQSTYRFAYLAQTKAGEKQTTRVEGTIDVFGRIKVSRQEPSNPPMCPICLADDTRIATPAGAVLVTRLRAGDVVWTLDASGLRVAAPIVALGSTPAPVGHVVVLVRLDDGREVRASPGHPLVDGRRMADLRLGDALDGAIVRAVARVPYAGATYDLLPAGATGAYWANDVLLASTLRR